MANHSLTLDPHRTARFLSAIAMALIVANLTGQLIKLSTGHDNIHGFVPMFNLDAEVNVPTLFAVFLLLSAAALLFLITSIKRRQGDVDTARWGTLAVGFALMAVDEGWSWHERLNGPVGAIVGDDIPAALRLVWVIPAFFLLAVLGVCFSPFLLRLPKTHRYRFLLAGAIFVGGAVGVEMLGSRQSTLHGPENLTYSLCVTVEEGMENFGVIYFVFALLTYLREQCGEIRLKFD